jgi:hypothetical protein
MNWFQSTINTHSKVKDLTPSSILHQVNVLNLMQNKTDEDNSTIIVKPLLMKKNESYLALYLLDHITEVKLSVLLNEKKLIFD